MFTISVGTRKSNDWRMVWTDDPYGWLDRAYSIDPDMIVLSIETV